MALRTDLVAAYSASAAAWQSGPSRIYDRLADLLVSRSPGPVQGATVVDIGAGTGAGGRAARRAGAAAVVSVDAATGMLLADPDRPPAAACDAQALPLRDGAVDVAVAAFCLNHLAQPARGVREAARVVRRGGSVVVGAYANDDSHPVKETVEQVLERHGWRPAPWVRWMKAEAVCRLATIADARAAAEEAGLGSAGVEVHRVAFADLTVAELVDWRLGMAQHAPFVARLEARERASIGEEVVAELGAGIEPLVRSVVVLTATL